ncbi:putative non-specific serine/threonine protein kinase [Helianthus annuus]|nr:putative non-specific serine/threonine protein kinase [Helianthus annuus]
MNTNPTSPQPSRCTFTLPTLITFTLLLTPPPPAAAEDDVNCLRGLLRSLHDPDHTLSSWNFNNNTAGFICRFDYVGCWNDQENRVISLKPADLGLAGTFPSDIRFCKNLQTLDLSGNNITGEIPTELCTWLPYLVDINLSGNRFTGQIPSDFGDCAFLNIVDLSSNRLSGNIPVQLSMVDGG